MALWRDEVCRLRAERWIVSKRHLATKNRGTTAATEDLFAKNGGMNYHSASFT